MIQRSDHGYVSLHICQAVRSVPLGLYYYQRGATVFDYLMDELTLQTNLWDTLWTHLAEHKGRLTWFSKQSWAWLLYVFFLLFRVSG